MKVSQILQSKGSNTVATLDANQPITTALSEMAKLGIGALVISKDGAKIDGILSERDIVRALASSGDTVLYRLSGELMTQSVETCFAGETAHDVLTRMTDGRFRHMPVVDENRKMIGILSIGDVVKARLAEIEAENAAMADMLSS